MKKITVNKTRILTAAAALVAVFSLAGCGSNAVQEIPRSAETSRSEEATPETAAPEATATPTPTPEPTPAVVVPTSVTLEQEGGILNNGMTWTLHATVLPEDAADKTLTWTSADESVATIDDSGVITTHAPGQTTITAASTAGGVSTTYNLVVQEVVKCSYCGGTGHTSDTCAVKKTAEQQAAAVVAQQQAAGKQIQQNIAPRHQRNQCRRSQVTHRNHWADDLSGNQINPADKQRHRAGLAQAAAPYAGKHIQVARELVRLPLRQQAQRCGGRHGIGAAQVVKGGGPGAHLGRE